jgi:hypothetical protein
VVTAFGSREEVRSLEEALRGSTVGLDGVMNDGHVNYVDVLRQ